jgi:hypothetical protein
MTHRPAIAVLVILCAISVLLWWLLRSSGHGPIVPEVSNVAGPRRSQAEVPAIQASVLAPERTTASPVEPPKEAYEPQVSVGGDAARSTFRLFGSVLLPDGRAFEQPETVLVLTDAAGHAKRATIESGKYAFDGLEAGPYVLTSRKPGSKHLERNVLVEGRQPAQELDLTIERAWTIDVRLVTPDGEDLRARLRAEKFGTDVQPTICCTLEPPGERLAPTSLLDHSRDGVSLPASDSMTDDAAAIRIFVQADPPIHVNVLVRDFVLATRRLMTPETEMTFVIAVDRFRALLSGVTVRLVDGETGLPATTGGASLETDQSMESCVPPDEQGLVRFKNRLPGIYELHAHLKGFPIVTRRLDLSPGITTDLGTITFVKGFGVSGRCIDESGAPKRVPMLITPLGSSESRGDEHSMMNFVVNTDPDGTFSVRNLQRSRHCLRVLSAPAGSMQGESGWSARPLLVDTKGGSVDGLVVVVERPKHAVLHPTAPGVIGMKFAIVTADGLVATDGEFFQTSSVSIELAKGDYMLRLSRGDNRIRELPLQVAGETTSVEIDP